MRSRAQVRSRRSGGTGCAPREGLLHKRARHGHWDHRFTVLSPFFETRTAGKYSVMATVKGGGLTGQAEALRHGIATALQGLDARLRPPLKTAGFLTRDSRRRERKKFGQKGARKKFAWVKR